MTRKIVTALATSLAALSLAACSTMTPMMEAESASAGPPQQTSVAGAYLAANFAAATGDVTGAAAFYANTLKEDPENGDILSRAFLYAAESGQVDAAIALTDRVLLKDPNNRPAHLVKQVAAIARKDYGAVETVAQPAGGGRGAFTVLTDNVIEAWALAGARDFDGALAALDKLSAQRGVDGLRLMHKAMILEFAGRDAQAQEAYHETFTSQGAGPRAADAFGRFLIRSGRGDEARGLYQRVLRDNPGHPVATAALRDIAANRNPPPLVNGPAQGVAEALFGIAASLSDQRSADVAILYLNLALYLRPDFDLGRVLLANRYEGLNKFDIANTVYARIQSGTPYYAMTQVQAAINDGRIGQQDAGIRKLRALVAAQPDEPDVWTALGDLLRGTDQYNEAIGAYGKAITGLRPGDGRLVMLFYARGVSLEQSGRWDAAESDFQAALKINPDRADVLNYLGYSWVERERNLPEAVTMLEKARALRPLDGPIADSVGWAYYKLARYPDAVRALEEAVQLSPGAADINDHLGDAYWRVGRRIDARFQWNHALALQPDEKQKPVIERKLQFGLDAVSASGQ
ncbi:MAG: tetratricopeptide repeat protein [Alphaproteobacteria bacterium]|nr:tetratricopeptide repeat protein [Alphaproteobacteria bacterium]